MTVKKKTPSRAAAPKRPRASVDLVHDMQRELARTRGARGTALMAIAVRFQPAKQRLRIELASGAAFELPVSAIPELANATPVQLSHADIDRSGTWLRWRDVGREVELSVTRLASLVFGDSLVMARREPTRD